MNGDPFSSDIHFKEKVYIIISRKNPDYLLKNIVEDIFDEKD